MRNKKIYVFILIFIFGFAFGSCSKRNKGGFELVYGSGPAMTSALKSAVKNKEWIVITGWTPHWMFIRYKLKYLKDPKKIYGHGDDIYTLARKDLKKDMPQVYKLLSNFRWTAKDMGEVMLANEESNKPHYKTAKEWVEKNMDKVKKWIPENFKKPEKKKKVTLIYVNWASEIASTHVVGVVLQELMGYKVKFLNVSIAAMWEGIANGDADAMFAAWLPGTSSKFMKKVKHKVDNLGLNLKGTKLGLVVPEYVTIDEISEMKKHASKFENRIVGIGPGSIIMERTQRVIKEYGLD